MLEFAFIGEPAFFLAEFGAEHSGRTQAFSILRPSKGAVCVLASRLLLLTILLLVLALFVLRSCGVIVSVGFRDVLDVLRGVWNNEPVEYYKLALLSSRKHPNPAPSAAHTLASQEQYLSDEEAHRHPAHWPQAHPPILPSSTEVPRQSLEPLWHPMVHV